MEGLLGVSSPKNIEQMALELGKNVRRMQHFTGILGLPSAFRTNHYSFFLEYCIFPVSGINYIYRKGRMAPKPELCYVAELLVRLI
jgi:hypothetical protein